MYFEFKPSILKILFKAMLILIWLFCAVQVFSAMWGILAIVAVLMMDYIADRRAWTKRVKAFAQLDNQEWNLAYSNDVRIDRVNLLAIHDYGVCLAVQCYDEQHQQSRYFCIVQDQVSSSEWRKLKTLAQFVA